MKRTFILLVIIGMAILLIGFWLCDNNSTKVYRVYEWTQETQGEK